MPSNSASSPSPTSSSTPSKAKAYVLATVAAAGLFIGAAGVASAATTDTTATGAKAAAPAASSSSSTATAPDPATAPNGPGETLLTGTTADQVTAAALASVPGSTVVRVETDSSGSPYEAHLTKADGTHVTVKVDASFTVTSTEDGFGAGPAGHGGGN